MKLFLPAQIFLALAMTSTLFSQLPLRSAPDTSVRITLPGPPLGIAWGMVYGAPFAKNETFLPQIRDLGAGFTKVNLFWSQIEPRKGAYQWDPVDAYLAQLRSPEEGLLALFSSSPWATRTSTWVFPPTPAKSADDYYRFVHDVVAHAKGRVRYFQNDAEPNNPLFWSGTKEEYVAQLRVFYRAVKDADPDAKVVLGGCDGLFDPSGTHAIPGQEVALEFFDYVLKEGARCFDVFDLHLYADPYTIPARVAFMRAKMASHDCHQPIIATEYNGPGFFEFPINRKYFGLLQSWSESLAKGGPAAQKPTGAQGGVAALYEHSESLAPETRMFLMGEQGPLADKLQRLQARDLVIRNIFALSAGVQKTAYWDLWHETQKRDDVKTLLYGKHKLLDYEPEGELRKRYPLAYVFQRMAKVLADTESIRRLSIPGKDSVYLFEVTRSSRRPFYVIWEKRDLFSGEEGPVTRVDWKWPAQDAVATDIFGNSFSTTVKEGQLSMDISVTPLFVELKD